jgi:hypothetical protein
MYTGVRHVHLTAHHGSAMQFPCFVPWFMGGLPFWEWVSLNLIRPSRLPLCPNVSSRMHKGLPSCACHARFFVSIELQDTGERFSFVRCHFLCLTSSSHNTATGKYLPCSTSCTHRAIVIPVHTTTRSHVPSHAIGNNFIPCTNSVWFA